MVKLDIAFNKFTDMIDYSIFAILAIVIGYLGDLIALLMFPGYDLTYMISALGIGPGAIYFNVGTIICGIFCLLFYIRFNQDLKIKSQEYKRLFEFARATSIISTIFFTLVGFFPGIPSNIILFTLHGLTAMISWLTAISYLISYGILIMKTSIFSRTYSILAFITTASILVFLFTWNPILEWLMTIFASLWIITLAFSMIKK